MNFFVAHVLISTQLVVMISLEKLVENFEKESKVTDFKALLGTNVT